LRGIRTSKEKNQLGAGGAIKGEASPGPVSALASIEGIAMEEKESPGRGGNVYFHEGARKRKRKPGGD